MQECIFANGDVSIRFNGKNDNVVLELFIDEWRTECDEKSFTFYRIFKKTFGFETYLTSIPFKHRKYLINYRARNHKLPIKISRWKKKKKKKKKKTITGTKPLSSL